MEILSPAGHWEAMVAAVQSGADAVYMGFGDFNARRGAKNFTREEFRCKCGGTYCNGFPAEPQEKMVRAVDRVRNHFGRAFSPNSGVRCPTHNANVGGVANSRHLRGRAVDFGVPGKTAAQVLAYVETLPDIRYCYAIDEQNVHMDIG